jgi:hypothetical protein
MPPALQAVSDGGKAATVRNQVTVSALDQEPASRALAKAPYAFFA